MCGRYYVDDDTAEEIEKVIRLVDAKVNGKLPVMEHIHKGDVTPSQAVELINTLKPLVANDEVDVLLCVPAIDTIPAMDAAKGSNIMIVAENMYFEKMGAFTGEICPAMLDDAGVKYEMCIRDRI